jgi:hypothetical protein
MNLMFFFLVGLLNLLPNQQVSDSVYYTKVTNVRNYMDLDRSTITEYWTGKNKSCTLVNHIKTIFRNDLGLIYKIDLQAKTYRIDSIKTISLKLPSKTILDFKYIGQEYTPVFEYNDPKSVNFDTICNHKCERFLCEGDADFDHIWLDYYITKTEDQSLAIIINSIFLSYGGSGNKRDPLISLTKNKNIMILRLIEKVENPISPPITMRISVETIKKLYPEKDLFELPFDFNRIK